MSYLYTSELGYPGPLYAGPLAMIDDMLGPSPMRRPDSLCRNSTNRDQYDHTQDAIYDALVSMTSYFSAIWNHVDNKI